MNVHVDETGRDNQAGSVEFRSAGRVNSTGNLPDGPVLDGDVADFIQFSGRIDNAAVLND
jgi:hypothetical protein